MRRLGRMEDLIERMKTEGKDFNGKKPVDSRDSRSPSMPMITREISEGSRSQDDGGSEVAGDGTSRYIGSAFFRSLTSEVLSIQHRWDFLSFCTVMLT